MSHARRLDFARLFGLPLIGTYSSSMESAKDGWWLNEGEANKQFRCKALGSMEIYEADYRSVLPDSVEPDSDEDVNRDLASGLCIRASLRITFRSMTRGSTRSPKTNSKMTRRACPVHSMHGRVAGGRSGSAGLKRMP